MIDGLIILLLCLVLLFLFGLYGRFAQGPESVRELARDEIDKAKTEGEAAKRALREEVAQEASVILDGVKSLHAELIDLVRREIEAAESRAEVAKISMGDIEAMYTAAMASLDKRHAARPVRVPSPNPERTGDSEGRRTAEMPDTTPSIAVDESEPEEEMTQVSKRPIPGTPAASNGLRLVPSRPAMIPPPGAEPPAQRGPKR